MSVSHLLGDAQVFYVLDVNSGYRKIEVDKADREKTAFASDHIFYQYKNIPFCLKNAPTMFQTLMDIIPSTIKWKYTLVYLDAIIVFPRLL